MDPAGLIAALPLGAMLIGPDGRIKAANDRLNELFGASLVGRDHVSALRRPELLDAIERARASREAQVARLLQRRSDADRIWQISIAPVEDASALPRRSNAVTRHGGPLMTGEVGPSPSLLVCFEDVTPIEAAEQMRRDFVANVSHELKSPLTALLGFIETLRGPAKDDPSARARFLGIMADEAQRMNRLVSDLLSLSRVEAEERQQPQQQIELAPLIRRSLAPLKATIEDGGAVIELDLPEVPIIVAGDSDQLQQVIANLVENALKYGRPGGKVSIGLSFPTLDPALRTRAVRLTVRDEGEGIDAVHLPRLTERFYRVDTHRSRQTGGTGLGLAIVKHIVGRHRGRMAVESEKGKGSRFSVILPVVSPEPKAPV